MYLCQLLAFSAAFYGSLVNESLHYCVLYIIFFILILVQFIGHSRRIFDSEAFCIYVCQPVLCTVLCSFLVERFVPCASVADNVLCSSLGKFDWFQIRAVSFQYCVKSVETQIHWVLCLQCISFC
jgi:hypothetical protein